MNGLKLVLDSYVKNAAVEARYCLNNSSFRPVVSYACQNYENVWNEKDYDLDSIEFPGFPDDSFGGFPMEQMQQDVTIPAQVVDIPPNNNNGRGRRQLHTWSSSNTFYHKRYCTESKSEIKHNKYKITDNQQV